MTETKSDFEFYEVTYDVGTTNLFKDCFLVVVKVLLCWSIDPTVYRGQIFFCQIFANCDEVTTQLYY